MYSTKCAGSSCIALSVRVRLYNTKCADLLYVFEALLTLSVRPYWVGHGQRTSKCLEFVANRRYVYIWNSCLISFEPMW